MYWNLLVACVVLTTILRAFKVSTEIFTSNPQGRWYSCKYEAVIFNLTLLSELSCAFKCQIRKGCKSFNFKEESCIGCKESCYKNDRPSESSAGQCWKRKEPSSDCQIYVEKIDPMRGGVFRINSVNGNTYDVYCFKHWDDKTVWTAFLQRINENLEFNRSFVDYSDGFGDIQSNHWRGLEFLHEMTTEKSTELLFLIVEKTTNTETSTRPIRDVYTNFSVGPAPGYKLSVGELLRGETDGLSMDKSSGTKTRFCFAYSNNNNFSTMDFDQSGSSCSSKFGFGGWWWNNDCLSLNPTGSYMDSSVTARECGGYKLAKELTMAFRTKK